LEMGVAQNRHARLRREVVALLAFAMTLLESMHWIRIVQSRLMTALESHWAPGALLDAQLERKAIWALGFPYKIS
jgi:hypothetical protein